MYTCVIIVAFSVIAVDGAIHNAAGWSLRDECEELNGCEAGNTKLTSGHRLPAKCKAPLKPLELRLQYSHG